MSDDDFDLARLADYLHLAPAQVSRLVERGHLPGRRVGGTWRFSQAEVHHWLEDRIGLSDEIELARMEHALDRSAPPGADYSASLVGMLPLEAIAVPLAARTRNSVIESMVELAAQSGLLWDAPKMVDAVRRREQMHPTALENGVALLHPRRPIPGILAQPLLAFGRTERGIPFGGSEGVLTDLFFLIASTDDQGHLRTLARLSRLIAVPEFLTALRNAMRAIEVHEAIAEFEAKLV